VSATDTITPTTGRRVRIRDSREISQAEREWQLVELFQSDPASADAALAELYELTHDAVFRYLRSRAPRDVAEDLTADTYERACRRLHTITRRAGSPAAWLITIARNLLADHYKSARINRTVLVPTFESGRTPEGRDEADNPVDPTDATDAALDLVDVAVALYGALTRLSPEQREVLVRRYLDDQSLEETAGDMGKNAGAIKALAYRATRALRRDPAVAVLDPALIRLAV
jgi:RNA polymerase sigma-70 factor (ECF subfamily)